MITMAMVKFLIDTIDLPPDEVATKVMIDRYNGHVQSLGQDSASSQSNGKFQPGCALTNVDV